MDDPDARSSPVPTGIHASSGEKVPDQSWPTIGRIVHFVWMDKCRAALVAEEHTDHPNMTVFIRADIQVGKFRVKYDPEKGQNSWHWPCR
jgi:hypothetical protein